MFLGIPVVCYFLSFDADDSFFDVVSDLPDSGFAPSDVDPDEEPDSDDWPPELLDSDFPICADSPSRTNPSP